MTLPHAQASDQLSALPFSHARPHSTILLLSRGVKPDTALSVLL